MRRQQLRGIQYRVKSTAGLERHIRDVLPRLDYSQTTGVVPGPR